MVHLSDKQPSRVIADAYGKTPLAYLTMLRAEEMARKLRETDLTSHRRVQAGNRHDSGGVSQVADHEGTALVLSPGVFAGRGATGRYIASPQGLHLALAAPDRVPGAAAQINSL